MNSEEIKQQAHDWVIYCGRSNQISCLPYIDAPIEIDERFQYVWEIGSRGSRRQWQDALEEQLLRDPANRALRFAALYPFLDGGQLNPYSIHARHSESCVGFRHLAGLCVPDNLTSLADLKFELYNVYLAADWDRADEVLRRIAILDLLPARELYLLRGQFWFLSVFGRRIEFELQNRDLSHEFFWPIPWLRNKARADERTRALYVFARPEILTWGAPAHWVLTAWCTNPRAPKPRHFDPEPIFVGDPDEPGVEEPTAAAGDADSRSRMYEHERYREFEPIAPPKLTQRQRERLLDALRNLREGFAIDREGSRPYLPIIARTLFCLEQFEEAAETYDALAKMNLVLEDPLLGEADGDWEWLLCFHRCLCLKGAGKHDAAISALAEFAERRTVRLPDPINKIFSTWGTGWWIAKWYSEQGRYHQAAQFLKTELESLLSPPESWQLSTILVLESVVQDQERPAETARQHLASHPDIQQIMRSMISDLWPVFGFLSQESVLHWLAAVHLSFADCPLRDARGIWLNNAIREYGWVFENELRTRVFDTFRAEVQQDRARIKQAQADFDTFSQKFYRFLAKTKEPQIELGGMVFAVEQSQASLVATDIDFAKFLQNVAPQLHDALPEMKKALSLRNDATHKNLVFGPQEVREMAGACRTILERLYSGRKAR
jgi:tetratricopeptide (TPR) repeat protein